MFAKVFKRLFYGSLTAQGDVQLVFICLLVHADLDGHVELPRPVIASMTGLPMDRIDAAIAILEAPDSASQSSDKEGRRLDRFNGNQWHIVNYLKYRAMRDDNERRLQNREAKRRQRVSSKVSRSQPQSAHAEAEAEVEVEGDAEAEKDLARSDPGGSTPRLLLPVTKGKEVAITEAQIAEFSIAYPGVDVCQQLRAMRAWLVANPSKRKTASGVLRFVNAWLAKEQNRGSTPNGHAKASDRGMSAADIFAMAARMKEKETADGAI